MSVQKDYWMQLYSNLLNACPVDTRNMVTHISLLETPTAYTITIEAPYKTNKKCKKTSYNGMHNYAGAVNYAGRSPHKYWVEKQIELTKRIMRGRNTL